MLAVYLGASLAAKGCFYIHWPRRCQELSCLMKTPHLMSFWLWFKHFTHHTEFLGYFKVAEMTLSEVYFRSSWKAEKKSAWIFMVKSFLIWDLNMQTTHQFLPWQEPLLSLLLHVTCSLCVVYDVYVSVPVSTASTWINQILIAPRGIFLHHEHKTSGNQQSCCLKTLHLFNVIHFADSQIYTQSRRYATVFHCSRCFPCVPY